MELFSCKNGPNSILVVLRPSITGGRFIVAAEHGPDFVGDRVILVGVTKEDAAAIEEGNLAPLTNYLEPSDQENGVFTVTELIDGVDVARIPHGPADTTDSLRSCVQQFQETRPYTATEWL